jgi:soluble lytic murein transglycosylase-like protein
MCRHPFTRRAVSRNPVFARPQLVSSLLWGLLLVTVPAMAAEVCTWETVAARYGVNAQVLYAIARQESSLDPSAVRRNADGSYDFGLTQINSQWLPHLAKFGITSEQLMDPCINLNVGAYVLALNMQRHGNTWKAIGAYHSSTPERRDRYAQSIYRHLSTLGMLRQPLDP